MKFIKYGEQNAVIQTGDSIQKMQLMWNSTGAVVKQPFLAIVALPAALFGYRCAVLKFRKLRGT